MSRIAVLMKGYPRLSETFIAQEILGLEKRGISQLIVSMRHPTDPYQHDLHREIKADILYLTEYLKDDPARVRRARRWAQKQPGYQKALTAFKADLKRQKNNDRYRRFGQACVMAHELPHDIKGIYVHYLHTPASVGRYAAMITGLPLFFSAHAKDIWTTAEWDLRQKIAFAEWGVTCTGVNETYLSSLSDNPQKVHLLYHGLDFSRFPEAKDRASRSNQSIKLISVGRAVEKKGYDDLFRALKRIESDDRWHFHHIGGGELSDKLEQLARDLGLEERITFAGALDRASVIKALMDADLFVLASKVAKSGDRDGLPNVLMEAQAMGLPVVSTSVSAIPEIIVDGETGFLVEAEDDEALAGSIQKLLDNQSLRLEFGAKAATTVRSRFSPDNGLDWLAGRFKQVLEG